MGRYYDHLKIDKKIVLLGVDSGSGMPVLDATGYASPLTVSADGVVVEGLRLMNGGPGSAGILVLSSTPFIGHRLSPPLLCKSLSSHMRINRLTHAKF